MTNDESAGREGEFNYQTLPLKDDKPWIRLLSLPDDVRSPEYSLSSHELDGSDEYCALSYVWGIEPPSSSIQVNGQPLRTRPNLAAALLQLVEKAQPRRIWIDAVSIDQSSVDERNSQVALMARIYAKAKKIYVWFGEADEASDFVMRPNVNERLPGSIHELPADAISHIRDSLGQFCQRKWWSRLWVVQECVFAKSIVALCGVKEIDWSSLVANLKAVHGLMQTSWSTTFPVFGPSEQDQLAVLIRAIAFADNLSDLQPHSPSSNTPLLTRLISLRPRHSTDPRDKVFATLGLVSTDSEQLMSIDYELEISQIYTNVAIRIINLTKQLEFLSACDPTTARSDLPSWVPDWSDTTTEVVSLIGLTKLAPFAAGGRTPLQAETNTEAKTLKLRGIHWGVITFSFPLAEIAGDTGLLVLFVCVLIYVVMQRGVYVGVEFDHAFIISLSAGVVEGGRGGSPETRPRTEDETHRIADWLESTGIVKRVRGDIRYIAEDSVQMRRYFAATARKIATGDTSGDDTRGEETMFRQGVEEWVRLSPSNSDGLVHCSFSSLS